MRWRDPNLTEVIGFLNNPNNVIKANAAAYLQHLCYMDDPNKQKTRALGGIPPLTKLLTNESPDVYRNACGALRYNIYIFDRNNIANFFVFLEICRTVGKMTRTSGRSRTPGAFPTWSTCWGRRRTSTARSWWRGCCGTCRRARTSSATSLTTDLP